MELRGKGGGRGLGGEGGELEEKLEDDKFQIQIKTYFSLILLCLGSIYWDNIVSYERFVVVFSFNFIT